MDGRPIPELLQLPHQAGFAESGRGLGEMLVGLELQQSADISLLQLREGFQVVQPLVVTPFRGIQVQAGETGELHHRPGGPEQVSCLARPRQIEVDGGGVVHRRSHLAGHEPEPDQLIELGLVWARGTPGLHWDGAGRRWDEWPRGPPGHPSAASPGRGGGRKADSPSPSRLRSIPEPGHCGGSETRVESVRM